MRLTGRLCQLFQPGNPDEEIARRHRILNIILGVSILMFVVLNLIRLADLLIYENDRGLPIWSTSAILIILISLFWAGRRGWIRLASIVTVILFSLPMIYSFIIWGADLPAGLLLAVLSITLAGTLISTRVVLPLTALLGIFLTIVTVAHSSGRLPVRSYWRAEPAQIADAITYSVLLLLISIIAWLFLDGIQKALSRARSSEQRLMEERDSLEIRVAERTRQLRQAEEEKIGQLYRLAEFGRLSSGIFHDLVNPLTAVALNLEQIKDESPSTISRARANMQQAMAATKKMSGLIAGIKKQIRLDSRPAAFSVREETEEIIQILSYKARRSTVTVESCYETDIRLYGDAVRFGQIISNLLANAIEACEENCGQRLVRLEWSRCRQTALLKVSDTGPGISPENLERIFLPFFSTKKEGDRGLGLGLATARSIAEKDFQGTITAGNLPSGGALFQVSLPLGSD